MGFMMSAEENAAEKNTTEGDSAEKNSAEEDSTGLRGTILRHRGKERFAPPASQGEGWLAQQNPWAEAGRDRPASALPRLLAGRFKTLLR